MDDKKIIDLSRGIEAIPMELEQGYPESEANDFVVSESTEPSYPKHTCKRSEIIVILT